MSTDQERLTVDEVENLVNGEEPKPIVVDSIEISEGILSPSEEDIDKHKAEIASLKETIKALRKEQDIVSKKLKDDKSILDAYQANIDRKQKELAKVKEELFDEKSIFKHQVEELEEKTKELHLRELAIGGKEEELKALMTEAYGRIEKSKSIIKKYDFEIAKYSHLSREKVSLDKERSRLESEKSKLEEDRLSFEQSKKMAEEELERNKVDNDILKNKLNSVSSKEKDLELREAEKMEIINKYKAAITELNKKDSMIDLKLRSLSYQEQELKFKEKDLISKEKELANREAEVEFILQYRGEKK